jgi:hypothetical protein
LSPSAVLRIAADDFAVHEIVDCGPIRPGPTVSRRRLRREVAEDLQIVDVTERRGSQCPSLNRPLPSAKASRSAGRSSGVRGALDMFVVDERQRFAEAACGNTCLMHALRVAVECTFEVRQHIVEVPPNQLRRGDHMAQQKCKRRSCGTSAGPAPSRRLARTCFHRRSNRDETHAYFMIPAKNNTSSRTRIMTIVSSRNSPRAIDVCSTAKR